MANWVPYREEARGPKWQKFSVNYTDYLTGAGTYAKAFFSLPPGGVIQACKIKHSEAFRGGAIDGYSIAVGVSGAAGKYGTAYDVYQDPTATRFQVEDIVGGESHTANTSIIATASSTTTTLDKATHGICEIWLLWSRCD